MLKDSNPVGESIDPEQETAYTQIVNLQDAQYADELIANYNANFPKVGFQPPKVYMDAAVTVDRLRSLNRYGIIHIYSHGWAFPHPDSTDKEIYLQTGGFAAKLTGDSVAAHVDSLHGQDHDFTGNYHLSVMRHFGSSTGLLQIVLSEEPLILSKLSTRRR